ncbi:MAG: chemotaxis protein CheB [Actinobacteria bacterium]|nr:chemotaxis protein CheB [Actinomycetota bacterium]
MAAGVSGAASPLALAGASRGATNRVVGIAASTGGPPALATVLSGLAGLRAPVLVVQHLHDDFVDGLVEWMARTSGLPVKLAVHGEPIRAGIVYIGPGGRHLTIGAGRRIELSSDPVTIHRPSADELFRSMAAQVGASGVGVILTGMGADGEAGLSEMHRRGATTIGQDEATCAVYGMPRAAARAGALTTVAPLGDIAGEIVRSCVGVMA